MFILRPGRDFSTGQSPTGHHQTIAIFGVVPPAGLEPATSCLRDTSSNQLSYKGKIKICNKVLVLESGYPGLSPSLSRFLEELGLPAGRPPIGAPFALS